jgi:peptide/nickel transport system permease protein
MTAYVVRRLIQAIVILFLVTIGLFFAVRFLPGDPILVMMSKEKVNQYSPEQIAQLREEYGLNRPIIVQYFDWVGDVFHGDLGQSITFNSSVTDLIKNRVPITLHIGILGFIFAHAAGITIGIVSAVRRGSWLDTVLTILANIGITIPVFWLGIMMIFIFALTLGWLPVQGYTSPFTDFWKSTRQLIMPVLCVSIIPLASAARQTRSSVLEIMQQDYIRTAWSKGLREQMIIIRHALKNALIPVITLAGLGIATIIGGEVLVEQVFNIPGMGRLMVSSVMGLDYPVTQAIALVIAVVVVLANLIVDLSYGWLDPRIRYQ